MGNVAPLTGVNAHLGKAKHEKQTAENKQDDPAGKKRRSEHKRAGRLTEPSSGAAGGESIVEFRRRFTAPSCHLQRRVRPGGTRSACPVPVQPSAIQDQAQRGKTKVRPVVLNRVVMQLCINGGLLGG